MAVLFSLILSLLQAIILFYTLRLISGVQFMKKDYISIIGIIILSAILFFIIESKAVLFLFVASLIFMYYKNKFLGIVTTMICFFISYMANFTSLWLSSLIVDIIVVKYNFSIFYAITFTIFSLIYAYIARFFIKRLSFSDLSLNKLYLILVSLFLLIILGLIYFYLPNQNVSFGDAKFIS
ncbi:quorum-sensing sensor histidine kinase AgrC, partial [Staphylococcus cohnii]